MICRERCKKQYQFKSILLNRAALIQTVLALLHDTAEKTPHTLQTRNYKLILTGTDGNPYLTILCRKKGFIYQIRIHNRNLV